MARQFGNNTPTTNSQDNSTPEPSKQQLVLGVGAMIVIVLFIVFIFAKNSAIKHMQAEELAKAQEMAEQGAEDAQNAYDDLMDIGSDAEVIDDTISAKDNVNPTGESNDNFVKEPSDGALNYAFDIQPDNAIFETIKELSNLQKSIIKTYSFLQSEGYELPDIDYILNDSFDYYPPDTPINYHTQNAFYIDYYDVEKSNVDAYGNEKSAILKRWISNIEIFSTGWYYDLTEPTDVVLNRLFGYTEDESMFHFQTRLKEEGSYLYKTPRNMPAPACYFGISQEDEHYILACDDGFWNRNPIYHCSNYCGGYYDLYAQQNSVDKYKELCQQIDAYNSLRLEYLSALVNNIRTYVDAAVQNEYENYDF